VRAIVMNPLHQPRELARAEPATGLFG